MQCAIFSLAGRTPFQWSSKLISGHVHANLALQRNGTNQLATTPFPLSLTQARLTSQGKQPPTLSHLPPINLTNNPKVKRAIGRSHTPLSPPSRTSTCLGTPDCAPRPP
ncbi:hypothetical protein P691DRAFT_546007 [Macrolepiota fuliginosa MF-IS2]|uniref:Uncharacterized protein n=1 Tax=Macrolepiota fuliginosa MF-IS2 TaxID=1400762 RepID=A0A9P5X1L9_9AGAR|nr:hypothetical protein P691DRAFT_546007 [Macrolepiota fuliginosa MF-IS2]